MSERPAPQALEDARSTQSFALVAGGIAVLSLAVQLALVVSGRLDWTRVEVGREIALGALQGALGLLTYLATRAPDRTAAQRVALVAGLYAVCAAIAVFHDLALLSATRAGAYPSWLCVLLMSYGTLVPGDGRHHGTVVALSVVAFPVGAVVVWALDLHAGESLPRLLGSAAAAALPPLVCGAAGLGVVARRLKSQAMLASMNAQLDQLGAYQLERKLGEGGMGEVWQARHAFLAKPAAVKLIRAEVITGKTDEESQRLARVAIARFEREARATASLSSPHTIQIFDFGRATPSSFFYAMELLDGIDLHTLVWRYGPQSSARTIAILRQVCDSLAEAHDRGFIHRDIKPANVFLCRLGTRLDHVKVLDFGLVLTDADIIAHNPDAPRLTRTGHITGTPNSIAPEQASGEAIDGRADLYALGCVAYFVLTGTDVFVGETTVQYLAKHMRDPPEPPSVRRPAAHIDPRLEALVLRLLAKSREDRPASAQALADELDLLAASLPWTQADARAWAAEHGVAPREAAKPSVPAEAKTDVVKLVPQRPAR